MRHVVVIVLSILGMVAIFTDIIDTGAILVGMCFMVIAMNENADERG